MAISSRKSVFAARCRLNSILKPFFTAILVMTCCIVSANAEEWDHEYLGTEMLTSPWAVIQPSRITTDPPQTWAQVNGSLGDTYMDLVSPQWAPESTFTIEFGLNIVTAGGPGKWSQGLYVLAGPNLAWEILVDANRVSIFGATSAGYAGSIGLNVPNTFRFIVTDGVGELYLNNNGTPIISGISGHSAYPGLTELYVGDYGGSLTGDGQWDYLKWNNSQAIAVPEPSTLMSLAFGTLLVVMFSLKARRKVGL